MVDARLHPADVVAHDEEDVGFLLLLRGRRRARHRDGGNRCQQSEPDISGHTHGPFSHVGCPRRAGSLRPSIVPNSLRDDFIIGDCYAELAAVILSLGAGCAPEPEEADGVTKLS